MTKKKEVTIYDLKLHETYSIDSTLHIMRVPGGWNYINYEYNKTRWAITHITFVPYNDEFNEFKGYNTLQGVLRDDE